MLEGFPKQQLPNYQTHLADQLINKQPPIALARIATQGPLRTFPGAIRGGLAQLFFCRYDKALCTSIFIPFLIFLANNTNIQPWIHF